MSWFSFYSAISASILLKTGSISIPRTRTLSGPSLARYVFSIFSHYFLSLCTHLPLSSRSPRNAILSLCEYNQQLAHHASTHSKHRSSFWSSQLSGSLFIAMDTLPRVRGLLSHDIDRFSLLASIWWLSLWMNQRVCWHFIVLIWWYPSNDHLWSLQDAIPLSGSTLSFMLQTTRMLLLHSFHH